ncbi:uncharacterized protein LOC121386462 [Gigantopelta aegis]|uniref:uncharacterized protein LOC121386462 n=1 Tax=Gigantopelta aegis TaxID=1735272 RepID=UPI001B887D93|nr:uncharacterized protein LOC121386462 [Gigantopelta aegis]XP_041373311.1 uncharacterized protein LOC121386462 [Gigantopelta aegis]XP_041373320.1 uncharacterized protein LOC121386462 [Gigantopelta aegis]
MTDNHEIFIDVPFGKMSQTAKRYCSLDFDKHDNYSIHTPPKTHINNPFSYHMGTVGRATRYPDEPRNCTPISKSADLDIFQNKDVFSILPFECLPHPQKLRKKSSQKVRPPRRDFNKNFLVDNHLRQLKKRYAFTGSYENDCEQPLDEAVDASILSTDGISNRYTDTFDAPLNKIQRTCDTTFTDAICENKQHPGRPQKETFFTCEDFETEYTGNPFMETYLDLQLRKDFLMQQHWHPINNSTPVKEE